MTKEQIKEKIAEMLCNLCIEDRLKILDEAKVETKEQWDDMCSDAWEGYEP